MRFRNVVRSEAASGSVAIEPLKVRPRLCCHSSALMDDSPTVTAHPAGASLPPGPAASASVRCWRPSSGLSLRHTATTPAAEVVSPEAAVSGLITPPSMITAISFSEIERSSSERSESTWKMPRAPVGLAGAGMTCRFAKSTS